MRADARPLPTCSFFTRKRQDRTDIRGAAEIDAGAECAGEDEAVDRLFRDAHPLEQQVDAGAHFANYTARMSFCGR